MSEPDLSGDSRGGGGVGRRGGPVLVLCWGTWRWSSETVLLAVVLVAHLHDLFQHVFPRDLQITAWCDVKQII